MKANEIRLFFKKEKEILDDKFFKNKQLMDFVLNLILSSKVSNIKNIINYTAPYNMTEILYNTVKIASKEDLLLYKLLNKEFQQFGIDIHILLTNKNISILYYFLSEKYAKKIVLKHKIKKYKLGGSLALKPLRVQETAHAGSLALKPLRAQETALAGSLALKPLRAQETAHAGSLALRIYNNDIDITDNYLNNIYLIAKNIGSNIANVKLDKKAIIDFINLGDYNNKVKNSCIQSINVMQDILKTSDIANIINNNTDRPILDFANVFITKMFIKSKYKDLLNYDDFSIKAMKVNILDKQVELLNEVLL